MELNEELYKALRNIANLAFHMNQELRRFCETDDEAYRSMEREFIDKFHDASVACRKFEIQNGYIKDLKFW